MAFDDILGFALDRSQRASQKTCARRPHDPACTSKTLVAFQPAFAGKPFRDVDLLGIENIDSKDAVFAQERPGGGGTIDADDQ